MFASLDSEDEKSPETFSISPAQKWRPSGSMLSPLYLVLKTCVGRKKINLGARIRVFPEEGNRHRFTVRRVPPKKRYIKRYLLLLKQKPVSKMRIVSSLCKYSFLCILLFFYKVGLYFT